MTFDPYQEWLRLAAERPPSYYDLLGLPPFEADLDRIHQAGMERMAHVRRFQLGQHGPQAIELLGELARAFDCLSTPDRKAAYDEQLRGQQEPGPANPRDVPPSQASILSPAPAPENLAAAAPTRSKLIWAGAGVVLGLLLVGLSIVSLLAYASPTMPPAELAANGIRARLPAIADQTIDEGQTLALSMSIEDAAPGSAGWRFRLAPDAPSGARIDQRSGAFTWTPSEEQGPGDYSISVVAQHRGETELTTEFKVAVREVNSAPVLVAIEDATIDEEKRFELSLAAGDADRPANSLTYSFASGAPKGMRLDPKTGQLSWTPNEAQGPGTYTVGLRVSDGASPPGTAEQSFSIAVREVNRPPVLRPIGALSVDLYDLASVPLKAADPDLPKNKLTFSLDGEAPPGAKIEAESQTIVWRPPPSLYGQQQKISIRVADDAAKPLDDRTNFVIDVGRTATNSIGMKLVYIQPGEFRMGWEKRPDNTQEAAHRVVIEKPFYLGQCEVTVDQFAQFVDAANYRDPERDPSGSQAFDFRLDRFRYEPAANWRRHGYEQAEDHPVVDVSWDDVQHFCDWLGKREGRLYRLPKEHEWEYCCRAGTTTAFSSGDDDRSLEDVANLADASFFSRFQGAPTPSEKPFVKNSSEAATWNDGFMFTAPIGSFRPNDFGIYDMHGNAAEWCDGSFGGNKVARGGSFFSSPAGLRSAQRYWHSPGLRRDDLGFRVVTDGPEPISSTPLR